MTREGLDVDALAQEIRRVDGNHDLGAGQLAEALMPFIDATRASVAPVQVKGLGWRPMKMSGESWISDSLIGVYLIHKFPNGFAWFLDGIGPGTLHPTETEAKAAAQTDYETRILAALTAAPIQPVAVFGHGNLLVDTGTFGGVPAVFIKPVMPSGEIGALAPAEHQGPLDRLVAGEVYLTFPTIGQAQAVADAMVAPNAAPVQPVTGDLARLVERLKAHADTQIANNISYIQTADILMREAAADITALQAKLEAMKKERDEDRDDAEVNRQIFFHNTRQMISRSNHFRIRAERAEATVSELLAWKPTHRHVKRGSEYAIVGQAQVQCEDGLTDYEIATVYRGKDGELWVRRKSEFEDGRFEALTQESKP
ncbi:hypothetical protein [Mesorhizobium sp. INR15]|uniref:hypothetical protein n=1 Tax=Mesorhizobium sp. INR15 TaxID=2654248 RepID=UPI001896A406|nr:hypothetical protein [Mesorhizobium sp. INR15]QPC91475.1 hypothetical protein GA829_13120 [Mesorhizobium sp. INR15]